MKDFEKDLIYYPNPDPIEEPRFVLNSVAVTIINVTSLNNFNRFNTYIQCISRYFIFLS